jgi:hypothetical protein
MFGLESHLRYGVNGGPSMSRLPLQSKKFLAFQISNLGWLVLIGLAIYMDQTFAVQIAMVIVAGFVQIGYIGGQSMVDIYAHTVVPALAGTTAPALTEANPVKSDEGKAE